MVSLRPATHDDVGDLADIRNAALADRVSDPSRVRPSYTPSVTDQLPETPIRKSIDSENRRVLVAERDRASVAWAVVFQENEWMAVVFFEPKYATSEVREAALTRLRTIVDETAADTLPTIVL